MNPKTLISTFFMLLLSACSTGAGTDIALNAENKQEGIMLINVRSATKFTGDFSMYFLKVDSATGKLSRAAFADLTGDAVVIQRGNMLIKNSDNQEPKFMAIKVKASEYQLLTVTTVEGGVIRQACIGDNMKFKVEPGKLNYVGHFSVHFANDMAVSYEYDAKIDEARQAATTEYAKIGVPFTYSPPIKSADKSCAGYGPNIQ